MIGARGATCLALDPGHRRGARVGKPAQDTHDTRAAIAVFVRCAEKPLGSPSTKCSRSEPSEMLSPVRVNACEAARERHCCNRHRRGLRHIVGAVDSPKQFFVLRFRRQRPKCASARGSGIGGCAGKTFESSLAVLLFAVLRSAVEVRLAVIEHVVNDDGQFVSRGCHRFGRTQSRFETPTEGAQGTLRAGQRRGGQSQDCRRASCRGSRSPARIAPMIRWPVAPVTLLIT